MQENNELTIILKGAKALEYLNTQPSIKHSITPIETIVQQPNKSSASITSLSTATLKRMKEAANSEEELPTTAFTQRTKAVTKSLANKNWTKEELDILRNAFNSVRKSEKSLAYVNTLLPSRSEASIRSKLSNKFSRRVKFGYII